QPVLTRHPGEDAERLRAGHLEEVLVRVAPRSKAVIAARLTERQNPMSSAWMMISFAFRGYPSRSAALGPS
ncbi:MAG TPA: hypothetical protein VIQ25_00990, partial [Gemmatimonadales bacterium]